MDNNNENFRSIVKNDSEKKKFNFRQIKNNTFYSLYEVEHFLHNFKKFTKCIKLYKILK